MIIYNIRANGPYEYDKFILDFGQLHNLAEDAKHKYAASDVVLGKLYIRDNVTLSDEIDKITADDGLMNQIALLKTILTE